MKYWIKSCPPLLIYKTYLENMDEVLEWMDGVIYQTKKDCEKKGKQFSVKKYFDIFKKCFILLKVDLEENPNIKKFLTTSKQPRLNQDKIMTRKFPSLMEEWGKVDPRFKKQKGRKKKIPLILTDPPARKENFKCRSKEKYAV